MDPQAVASFLGNGLRFAPRGDRGPDRAQVHADASAPGATLLRVHFPAGSASPAARGVAGGMQADLTLPGGPCAAAVLEYPVRFGERLAFVAGGELPGGPATGGRRIRPGHDDGRIPVEQDGEQVLDLRGLRFRTDRGLGIDGLSFSTFFGGGDSSWASPTDQHVDVAGLTIAAGEHPAAATPMGWSPCA